MTCCCSNTCSRRNSISCSSLVRLRSFKDVCRFRDACADSFSFCSQSGREPRRAAQPTGLVKDPPCASMQGGWAPGYGMQGRWRGGSHLVPSRSRVQLLGSLPREGWVGPGWPSLNAGTRQAMLPHSHNPTLPQDLVGSREGVHLCASVLSAVKRG